MTALPVCALAALWGVALAEGAVPPIADASIALLTHSEYHETVNRHIALYGNVAMIRGICPYCEHRALVVKRRWACCGANYEGDTPARLRRMISPEFIRRTPKQAAKIRILNEQDQRCFYCERLFGSFVQSLKSQAKLVRLIVHWDHLVPFVHSQNNNANNFVAACQQCNALKYCLMFQTVEEARIYVQGEIKARYRRYLQGV